MGLVRCELPRNRGSFMIASSRVAAGEFPEELGARNALIETLVGENAEPQFGHVEPAVVLRCAMKLEPADDAAGGKVSYRASGVCVLRLSRTRRMRAALG